MAQSSLPMGRTRTQLRGNCSCGKIHFVTDGVPSMISNCHCKRCRQGTEYPFIAWASFPTGSVQVTLQQDAKNPVTASNTDIGFRESCTSCGMEMFMKYHCRPGIVSITLRSFKEPDRLPQPAEHIFLADKAVWWEPAQDDSLDKWQEFDAPFEVLLEDWRSSGSVQRDDFYSQPAKRLAD